MQLSLYCMYKGIRDALSQTIGRGLTFSGTRQAQGCIQLRVPVSAQILTQQACHQGHHHVIFSSRLHAGFHMAGIQTMMISVAGRQYRMTM